MSRKRHLPRRTFLKGVGTALALPLLDAMSPGRSLLAAAGKEAPRRMAFISFPNGAIIPAWTPEGTGREFTLSATLEDLAPVKDDVIVFTGLAQDNAHAKGDGPGDHARSAAAFLTGAHPVKTGGADIKVGMSVDQVAAEKIGTQTKLPSLELGTERGRTSGQCDSGYSCAYSSTISWKSPTTPMAKEIHPAHVFERLFGSGSDADKNRIQRDFYRKSVLDLVAEDANRLGQTLGKTDRRKIDEYFTSVRELELRIQRAKQEAKRDAPAFDVPDGMPQDAAEHIRLMYDLMALAFQTDTTRIATFMLANEGSNRSYRMVDVNEGHHELSHHQNDTDKVAKIKKIDKFLMSQFARFLQKLKSIPEGEGTLLDNSMIVYGCAIGDGNRHNHNDLPIVFAGRGGGTIQTGRHLVYDKNTPLNNLFLSMLDRMAAPIDFLGDSTGRLPRLDSTST